MTEVLIDAGTLEFSEEDMTATGLLVPYNEECRSTLGRFSVSPGVFEIPEDFTGMSLNVEHKREAVVGAFSKAWEQQDGIYGSYRFSNTPAGRAAFAEAKAGTRKHLSAEVANVGVQAGKAVSGNLFAAALVAQPAFPSATLLAAAVDTTQEPDANGETTSTYESTSKNADGSEYSDKTETKEEREELPDGSVRITRTTVTVTEVKEPDAPAEEEGSAMGVPATLAASAANLVTPEGKDNEKDAREVFTLMASAMQGDEEARTLLAALTDIKTAPATAGTLGAVIQPAWLGEVWAQKTYQRRYMPLINQGQIVAQDEKGFTVSAGTEPVQPWSGNKTAVPSSSGTTNAVSSTFQRWGWAADIAREFFDIPGNTPVIEAFLRLVNNSYARVTDKWTLAQLVASATTVAPASYPALPSGAKDYPVAVKQLIQGVNIVSADPVDDTPAFAIVNAAAWDQIIYTPQDSLPAWMKLSFGIQTQDGSADGNVRVVRGDIGIANTPAVLVGARDAAHVNELGGASPLNLSALDIANGGIDRSVIGYTQFMAEYAAALVRVGVADS